MIMKLRNILFILSISFSKKISSFYFLNLITINIIMCNVLYHDDMMMRWDLARGITRLEWMSSSNENFLVSRQKAELLLRNIEYDEYFNQRQTATKQKILFLSEAFFHILWIQVSSIAVVLFIFFRPSMKLFFLSLLLHGELLLS